MWIQIWGVPFELMASKVAMEIGNKMGVVEDVEQRRRSEEQNLFLRVRVALPISKPIRRGGFLMGLDGNRHWVDYKYERLPVFCHFCGILGHDLRHCPAHYEESKRSTTLEYQYGDWLRHPMEEIDLHSVDAPVRMEMMGLIRKTTRRWSGVRWEQR